MKYKLSTSDDISAAKDLNTDNITKELLILSGADVDLYLFRTVNGIQVGKVSKKTKYLEV